MAIRQYYFSLCLSGTTSSAFFTALSKSSELQAPSLQLSLAHLFFNLLGFFLWFPLRRLRLPLHTAEPLGEAVAVYKWAGGLYIITAFILAPLTAVVLNHFGRYVLEVVFVIFTMFMPTIVVINVLQGYKNGMYLCSFLMTWDFLPIWLHSLEPYDQFIKRIGVCNKVLMPFLP